MDLKLTGKKALITGSSKGIGLAIAQRLAQEGAHVILNGRGDGKEAIKKVLEHAPGAHVDFISFDFEKETTVNTFQKRFPEVDILINNFGIYEAKDFFEISPESWNRIFHLNVLSGVLLSQLYLPGMLKRNEGRIIFISSESGLMIPKEMIHYGMTKTAQLSISRGLALMTQGTNVTVNSVLPGPTLSEGVADFFHAYAQKKGLSAEESQKTFMKEMRPTSLIARVEKSEEIADVVAFVASPLSSSMNGSAIRAEGGLVNLIH